jgi:response regulator RpfG family c-di-GMP phosphodiesterase
MAMETIVVVDDEPDIRHSINHILSKDYKVKEIESVDGAIEYCNCNPVDLVITDLFMPDKTGIDLIEYIAGINKDIKVLAISGGSRTTKCNFLPVAKIVGADDTLFKPFAMSELRKKVDALLSYRSSPPMFKLNSEC